MNGAGMLVELLCEQGVNTIFGYPGGSVLHIYDELYRCKDRITHYITCHEQAAAHAADGYARATGKAGVCLATSGPGAINLVSGIATAYLDSVPLVAITGNVPTEMIGRDSFQEVDIVGITMPVTKHNYLVKDASRLADIVREAFWLAQNGRPGPVLIDIPKDVQTAQCAYLPGVYDAPGVLPGPSQEDLKIAADLIRNARRPFVYVGGGVISAGAVDELRQLVDRIDAPAGASMMGLSVLPHDHPGFVGMVGMHGSSTANRLISECDLLIAVGTRFSDRATGDKAEFSRGKQVLHIDIDPAEIGKNIPAYTSVVGHVRDVIRGLLPLLPEMKRAAWRHQISDARAHCQSGGRTWEKRLNPQRVIQAVRRRMPAEGLVATDVGQHQMWTAQYYRLHKPRTLITSGGLGTMGFGMGAAIGACIATGKRRTVLFTSDGSFHMNLSELATAVTYGLPLVIVMLNNRSLGMVRQWQTIFFGGRYSHTDSNRKTDFVRLAESFGAAALRVETEEDLEPALEKAFSYDTPILVECAIDINEQVLPMIPPDGSVKDIILR